MYPQNKVEPEQGFDNSPIDTVGVDGLVMSNVAT